jgi:chaperonin cofactor prefoldin
MDISKYLKNKDITLSNDDVDIEKLTNDLRKGYIEENEAKANAKATYETELKDLRKNLEEKANLAESRYTVLENNYNDLNSRYTEQTNQLKAERLKGVALENGFASSDVEEVSKLRTSLYADIENDTEAVQKIKERYGKSFFDSSNTKAPDEKNFGSGNQTKKPDVVVTRHTSIKDLMK